MYIRYTHRHTLLFIAIVQLFEKVNIHHIIDFIVVKRCCYSFDYSFKSLGFSYNFLYLLILFLVVFIVRVLVVYVFFLQDQSGMALLC